MRHALPFSFICGAAAACSSPSDPFHNGDGYATVQGLVTQSSGAPVASTALVIVCAGGSSVTTTTDVSGQYLVDLGAAAASLNITDGKLRCRFTEPDTKTPRARVDTVLGFTRGPAMAPLQTVDLRE